MRNLRNIRYSTWRSPPNHQERQITATTWDTSSDSIICAYGPSESDTLVELVRVKKDLNEHILITSWDAPSPNTDLLCDQILNLQYFSDSLIACLVLAGGDIIVVREEPHTGEDRIEVVGSVDAGITAAKWSPDDELLTIATKADTIVFMSRNFEGVLDIAMTSEDLKASNHVSVGWGKKETQFKGKGAKALRDPTIPEKVDEGTLSPNDDGRTSISWRGDGAFVAISTIEKGRKRLIRVYSREGVLDSVSEPVDGLEGALSWRPAGNLIAGVQRFHDHIDVIFFERNGLKHGQFSLRLTSEELETSGKHVRLAWNNDSSVLAVLLANSVQLWTMGNYHWYLKQEIPVAGTELAHFDSLIWHPERALLFTIISVDTIVTAEFIFTVARGTTAPPNDFGVTAVIDGKSLKVTPFRFANVPPPMALHSIDVLENIIDVAFSAETSSIAVLHLGGISLYKLDISAKTPFLTLAGSYAFEVKDARKRQYQQISFGEKNEIITLHVEGSAPSLLHHGLNEGVIQVNNKSKGLGTSLVLMISSFDHDGSNHPFTQNALGGLHSLTFGDQPLINFSFPTFLPWVKVAKNGNNYICFGLSRSGHLYAGSRLLVKNCTSFLVTPAHLIFTTTTHLLKFVHITFIEDLEVPQDDPEKDERCRRIERGARLITAIPTSLSLVLQMPRGNLETIWPRAMVLAGIRKLVEEKNYQKAFLHCRTQRVDLNILYDHAPEQFMSNIGLFIDQIGKVAYIDLFLSSLREEDVTKAMYKETRPVSMPDNGVAAARGLDSLDTDQKSTSSTKVNRICDAVLNALEARTATNLQNIITANVCKSPPALDDGLLVVARLMTENESMAEKAVEHICFLADINKLYDNALGLYNLDLALLVAQQSQKDPREYLPFLQKLQEMLPTRRMFSIDDHLGRYTKALSHLYELSHEDFSEFEAYTVRHSLYKPALGLVRYLSSQLNTIMALYATHLESNSHFHEAAVAYESLHIYDLATTCYQRASSSFWRETLFCASQQNPPITGLALTTLATSLADSLTEAKDYKSAATIQLTYLSLPTAACTLLCKGYHFAEAMHLASQHTCTYPELLAPNGTIDIGLADALSSTTELLAECKAQLRAQVPRIHELRLAATADPLAFYEGESANEVLPDNVSIAASCLSTSASLFTRYTGRQSQGTAATGESRATSKNRRREERKRARGKKGTAYEEEYLVASVGRLVERMESVRDEVRRLVLSLVRRGMRERAVAVESTMAEVVELCQKALVEVWGVPDEGVLAVEANGEYRPRGADAVWAESIAALRIKKEAPHMRPFEKLPLLGT